MRGLAPGLLLLATVILGLAAEAHAQGFDGSAALGCTFARAAQCNGEAVCREVTVEQIDLPGEIQVDFAGRMLRAVAGERTSPITAVETLDAELVLQGHQNGRGWTMVIDRASGSLSATIADREGAFVLSGGCSAR